MDPYVAGFVGNAGMAVLSVAHRVALAQVIENVPDRTLRLLAIAVAGMPGERARILEAMLADAGIDRARRARGLAAIAPMFRPRSDGVAGTHFPAQVLPRLWKIVAAGEGSLLAYLDPNEDEEDDTYRIAAVCARLFAAAAAAVRDQPELVWPLSLGDAVEREAGLEALSRACDLGGLVHRALPSLKAWIGRPDGDQLAELRLLVRDAASISPDGAQQLLDVLFSHLAEAPKILRLVVQSSNAAGRDTFLSGSELAVFVDRLIVAAEVRAARFERLKSDQPVESLRADLSWIADFLIETDATIQIQGDSAWGKRLRQIRAGVSKTLEGMLGRVTRAVDKTLPMARSQTAGRMTRNLPQIDSAVDPTALAAAEAGLDLLRNVRSLAGPFGCEAQRQALVEGLATQLIAYADMALEEINSGDVLNEALAADRVMMVADFLERIEAETEARAVRRRVAVAGAPSHGASPRAA